MHGFCPANWGPSYRSGRFGTYPVDKLSREIVKNSTGRNRVRGAWIEALPWCGLLVGMFLKYVTDTTERGVDIMGPIHGVAFIAYVLVTLFAGRKLKWPGSVTLIALFAAIPPLMTIVAEYWISKQGLLGEAESKETAKAY